eukprot:2843677-Rhodomonas_salina.1
MACVLLLQALVQSASPTRSQMSTWASHEDVASLASTKEASVKDEGYRRELVDLWVPSAGSVTQIARTFSHPPNNPPSNTSSPTAASAGRIPVPKVLDIKQGTCPHCGLKGSKDRCIQAPDGCTLCS